MGVARVTLLGNVGRDPEIRQTATGTQVGNFSVGVSWKRKNEEQTTQWLRITVYDKLADVAQRFVSKGKQVYVEGRLNVSTYKDRDGNEKQQVEVIASELQVLTRDAPRDAPREMARPEPQEDIPF